MSGQNDNIGDELEAEGIPRLDDSDPAVEGMIPPRDFPQGVEEFGITAAEERMQEPLAERVLREEPDFDEDDLELELDDEDLASDVDHVGRLVEPESGVDEIDETKEVVAFEAEDASDMTAEEAAMHITDEP